MAEKKDGRYYLKKKIEELTKELNTEVKEHNALENKYVELVTKNKNIREDLERIQEQYRDVTKLAEKLAEEKDELQSIVDKQSAEISRLNVDIHNAETRRIKEAVEHGKFVDELFEHMGWFRRWIWFLDHAEKG